MGLTDPFHSETGDVGVLFCHGFTGSPHSLIEWAERTADAGYRVSLPRLPGHATRWQEATITSWEDWYACVEDELLDLRKHCEQVFVAGLSMGGTLALRLASQHRDIVGLLLVNPALSLMDRRSVLSPVLKLVRRSVAAVGNDIKRPGIEETSYTRTPIAGVHELVKLIGEVRSTLDLVTCPILAFRSGTDHVVNRLSVDVLGRQVSSRDVTVVDLPDSYHVATMDNERETIYSESFAFLERLTVR